MICKLCRVCFVDPDRPLNAPTPPVCYTHRPGPGPYRPQAVPASLYRAALEKGRFECASGLAVCDCGEELRLHPHVGRDETMTVDCYGRLFKL